MTPAVGADILSVRNISMRFGGIVALDDVSFDMASGHIVGLIGPNGAIAQPWQQITKTPDATLIDRMGRELAIEPLTFQFGCRQRGQVGINRFQQITTA